MQSLQRLEFSGPQKSTCHSSGWKWLATTLALARHRWVPKKEKGLDFQNNRRLGCDQWWWCCLTIVTVVSAARPHWSLWVPTPSRQQPLLAICPPSNWGKPSKDVEGSISVRGPDQDRLPGLPKEAQSKAARISRWSTWNHSIDKQKDAKRGPHQGPRGGDSRRRETGTQERGDGGNIGRQWHAK